MKGEEDDPMHDENGAPSYLPYFAIKDDSSYPHLRAHNEVRATMHGMKLPHKLAPR